MKLIYSDGASVRTGGPINLVRQSSGLYVMGRGYLCQVANEEEGRQLIRELMAARTSREPRLDL